MTLIEKILKGFTYFWVGAVFLTVLMGIIGRFLTAETVWEAISDVQLWFSPFNLWNFGLMMILLSPAFGAYLLGSWLQRKRETPKSSPQSGNEDRTDIEGNSN